MIIMTDKIPDRYQDVREWLKKLDRGKEKAEVHVTEAMIKVVLPLDESRTALVTAVPPHPEGISGGSVTGYLKDIRTEMLYGVSEGEYSETSWDLAMNRIIGYLIYLSPGPDTRTEAVRDRSSFRSGEVRI